MHSGLSRELLRVVIYEGVPVSHSVEREDLELVCYRSDVHSVPPQ